VEQELLILPEYLSSLPIFSGVRVAQPLVFYVVFCRSLLVLLFLDIVLCILQFTVSDYPFGIFKLFVLFIIFIFNKHSKYQKCFSQMIKFAGFI